MVFDPTEPDIDDSQFVSEDWLASAYFEFKEEWKTAYINMHSNPADTITN